MPSLHRKLGTATLTFYGIGMILGAGIYSVAGPASAKAGQSLWMSFLFSAVAALFTGFSYAEVATLVPNAGGEYAYLKKGFPKFPYGSSLVGFLVAIAGAATAATVSLSFANYLGKFVEVPILPVAAALLISVSAINLWGIQGSSGVNVVFTLIEVSGLLLFIGVGMSQPQFGDALFVTPTWGVVSGAALIFFSYLGFENIVNLSEEASDPGSQIPRSIFISLVVTTLIYILVGLAATALMSPEALSQASAPLAAASATVSPLAARLLTGVALFSTANTALIALLAASRVLFSMGREGDAPSKLSIVSKKSKSPWLATVVMLGFSLPLLLLGKVEVVASVSSFATLVAFISVHLTLIVLRYRMPNAKRPFRVPLSVGKFPLLPAFGLALSLLLLIQFELKVYAVSAVALTLATIIYFVHARTK